jgi:hypothetical protein
MDYEKIIGDPVHHFEMGEMNTQGSSNKLLVNVMSTIAETRFLGLGLH